MRRKELTLDSYNLNNSCVLKKTGLCRIVVLVTGEEYCVLCKYDFCEEPLSYVWLRINLVLSDDFKWWLLGDFSNFSFHALATLSYVQRPCLCRYKERFPSKLYEVVFVFDGYDQCVCRWNLKFGTKFGTEIVNTIFS
jgi:hypothetical protein